MRAVPQRHRLLRVRRRQRRRLKRIIESIPIIRSHNRIIRSHNRITKSHNRISRSHPIESSDHIRSNHQITSDRIIRSNHRTRRLEEACSRWCCWWWCGDGLATRSDGSTMLTRWWWWWCLCCSHRSLYPSIYLFIYPSIARTSCSRAVLRRSLAVFSSRSSSSTAADDFDS